MDSSDTPNMLLDRVVDVMTAFWGQWQPNDWYDPSHPGAEAKLLLRCIHDAGLFLSPFDPLLSAQETTGDWQVDP